uniref:Putative secreted protein n=1 Tax=Panstrongylus lignarius TaxID=156445 RepID=A0A224XPY0_9HEMI
MANISIKFIVLLATVAVLCSMCSGSRFLPRADFGGPRPGPSPFNPRPRPSPLNPVSRPIGPGRRFRREVAIVRTLGGDYAVNDALVLDEIVRQAREAPEEVVYVVETPEYFYTN